jgi:hypothetical protein
MGLLDALTAGLDAGGFVSNPEQNEESRKHAD